MNKHGFRFREWSLYKDARLFRLEVKKIINKFPSEEKYSLTDQTNRALNSILLNIAEGSNKATDKDTKLYISRSLGSLDEVVSCMDCALDDNYITEETHDSVLVKADSLAKQFKGFINYLSKVKD